MRLFTIAIMMLSAGCYQQVDPLVVPPPCGVVCAIDHFGDMVFDGEAESESCNTGVSECDWGGDGPPVITCPGFIPLGPEICDPDDIDENCDGLTNDIWYDWADPRNTCDGVGECRYSVQMCRDGGYMQCIPITPYYGPEVCDGRDNDCDGLTDGDDPDLVYDGDMFEYSGPPETINVGECRAGVRRCEGGVEYLFGEVRPTDEICGNSDDDDCDGRTDESDESVADAFLITIDFSGSMYTVIESVITALCDWSEGEIFTDSRFAIQAVSGNLDTPPYINNITDFVSAGDACMALGDFYTRYGTPGAFEYIAYGIWSIHNNGDLSMDWPQRMRRRVIFFTDEAPQSYTGNGDPFTDLDLVAEDCVVNKYSVGGFIYSDESRWRRMTDACNGWTEALSFNTVQIREDLDYRFGSECGR